MWPQVEKNISPTLNIHPANPGAKLQFPVPAMRFSLAFWKIAPLFDFLLHKGTHLYRPPWLCNAPYITGPAISDPDVVLSRHLFFCALYSNGVDELARIGFFRLLLSPRRTSQVSFMLKHPNVFLPEMSAIFIHCVVLHWYAVHKALTKVFT